MAKKTMKKSNPQDLTLRNLRALRKAVKELEARVSELEAAAGVGIYLPLPNTPLPDDFAFDNGALGEDSSL